MARLEPNTPEERAVIQMMYALRAPVWYAALRDFEHDAFWRSITLGRNISCVFEPGWFDAWRFERKHPDAD